MKETNGSLNNEALCPETGQVITNLTIVESENGRYGRKGNKMYSLVQTEMERYGKRVVMVMDTLDGVDEVNTYPHIRKGDMIYTENGGSFIADRSVTLHPGRFYIFGHSVYYATGQRDKYGDGHISLKWCGTDETLQAEETIKSPKIRYEIHIMDFGPIPKIKKLFVESDAELATGDLLLLKNPGEDTLRQMDQVILLAENVSQPFVTAYIRSENVSHGIITASIMPIALLEAVKPEALKEVKEIKA